MGNSQGLAQILADEPPKTQEQAVQLARQLHAACHPVVWRNACDAALPMSNYNKMLGKTRRCLMAIERGDALPED